MKAVVAVLGLVIILGGVWYFLGKGDDAAPQDPGTVESAQMGPLEKVKAGEAELLDVRTQAEWDEGHVQEAILFDSERIARGELPDLPKDREIYLYCRSGNRAGQVKAALNRQGFTNVTNLGGLPEIQALGAELVR